MQSSISRSLHAGHQVCFCISIRRKLDERDRKQRARARNYATSRYRTGATRRWRNRKSGNHGGTTPTSARYRVRKRVCRKHREKTVVAKNGKMGDVSGQACQDADGSWDFT
jgi:surface antigen